MALLPEKQPTQSLLSRYEQVLRVLVRYGFEDVVAHPPLSRLIPKSGRLVPYRKGRPFHKYTRYERIRMVCEELGTTFIKFAQIASNRPDLIPEELVQELTGFQDRATPVPEAAIRASIEAAFPAGSDAVFAFIDYQPLASASMAQVHRARMRTGEEVVLKIQRPGIDTTVLHDIEILKNLARVVESYFPQYSSFQPMELVRMFEKSILKELNFQNEALNAMQFREQFKENDAIYVPRVYPEHSSQHLLVMEYIQGIKISDLQRLKNIGLTGRDLAIKGINLYFEQVFEYGFFHADPHPGNIFVLPDGRICFIDFGMMGSVVESDREMLGDLLLAIADRDVRALKKALLRFSSLERIENEQELEYDIVEFFTEYSRKEIQDIDSQEVLSALNRLFFDFKIKVPPNLLLLLKALVIIEGVGLYLDPKYNIIENVEPFVRRLLRQKYAPEKIGRNLLRSTGEFSKLLMDFPGEFREVLRKVRKGKLHIQFEHQGLEPSLERLESMTNRISVTLLLVGLILGSSLLVLADIPPYIRNIPAIGVVGFFISGLLALRLLYSIFKHGKF